MYSLILRKGKIELELTTDDKDEIEKQLRLAIMQASASAVKHVEVRPSEPEPTPPPVVENFVPEVVEEQKEENDEAATEPQQPQEESNKTEEQPKTEEIQGEDIIATGISVTPYNPVTINSIQNQQEPQAPNFDEILTNEISQDSGTPITKDEKFIQYVEGKSAIEKLDFLIVAAQYLAQYENMNTFNLKHINAKLMQNFTIIVDHSVLQSAISREFITRIQEGSDETTTEYMLTEKGLRSY